MPSIERTKNIPAKNWRTCHDSDFQLWWERKLCERMFQEGRMEGWFDQEVPVDHTKWCLDMSSRHEGKFCKVFQVYLQDQVYNRSKYQKI